MHMPPNWDELPTDSRQLVRGTTSFKAQPARPVATSPAAGEAEMQAATSTSNEAGGGTDAATKDPCCPSLRAQAAAISAAAGAAEGYAASTSGRVGRGPGAAAEDPGRLS
mmetsp:Transcript_109839/g.306141  ORF Transcript_109839/g.306141 Transcript_109839/m.306141 type:complete len:110 (+) Transcript_109839:109-438(+)